MPSKLEAQLAYQLKATGIPFVCEFRAIPGRRFRWDFLVDPGILIEVQGGIYLGQSGHTSGKGVERDAEKINLATLAGYRTLQLTASTIRDGRGLAWIQTLRETKP